MIQSLLIGIGGMVLILSIWIGVQHGWRKLFSEYLDDDDVLAGRSSCSNCGCTTVCKKTKQSIST